ncbi:hypothetical protein CTI12_AA386660 [Artemisia annua]|uniref:Nucleic acid-binding, OB-fold protein n=1 Tax=Artemisia annua TaxID=35608 RepID=A0A2U1LYM4_ARTAN|nr:hypothetical protein CTI12_AA386660 [Artemisia annua]
MKSQNERVGGRVECSSSLNAQHTVTPEVARFAGDSLPIGFAPEVGRPVDGSLPIGLFSQNDVSMSARENALYGSNARECKRKSVDSTGNCDAGLQKRPRCRMPLGVVPSGGLMPIVIQCVAGSNQHGHLDNELHQLHAAPNMVSSAAHNVPLRATPPVPETSSVPSIAATPAVLDFQHGIVRYQLTDDAASKYIGGGRDDLNQLPTDQGPLQRPRTEVTHIPVGAPSLHDFGAPAIAASSTQTAQSFMHAPTSMTNATPTSEKGICMVSAIPDSMYSLLLFVIPRFYSNICAHFSGANTVHHCSQRRRTIQITEGERPSQRPRKNPPYTPLCRTSSTGLGTFSAASPSTQQRHPSVLPCVFPVNAGPTFAETNGTSQAYDATPSAIPSQSTCAHHPSIPRSRPARTPTASRIRTGPPTEYKRFGPCNCVCRSCHALFWYEERLSTSTRRSEIVQGLIHLLDANNALVQLFRSARDKLVEANVPEFKIRLFGKVGSAQHELPTSDEIGAIVFEGGPESETDFDVVIQRHTGEPERVNKLHPTYMSLQFPLLFIFGEQGYHTDLRLLDVLEGSLEGDKRVSMDAYYAYLLHDRIMADKNIEIPGNVGTSSGLPPDQHDVQQSKDKGKGILVEEDIINIMDLKPEDLNKPLELKVYRKWLSRNVPDPNPTGLCFILLDKQGGAIQANVQIWDIKQFDAKLQVNTCYRIQAYGCKKTDKWQRTLENDITLLFGRYTQVTEIQDTGFPNHYFNFAAYNQVGQRADSRDSILTDYIGIVRDTGDIRESGDSMTNRISRRNIEIQNLKYEEYMGPMPPMLPAPTETDTHEAQMSQRYMPISALLEVKPETNALRPFTIEAVITKIDETQGWYFNRCRICHMKIAEGWPHRQCQQPGIQPIPNYTYNFKATLADDTGSIVVTCFSPEANSLLLPVTEVLSYVPDRDPYVLPPLIKALEDTSHVFTVHIAPGSRRGNTKYILEHAADAPTPTVPITPTTPGAGSSSTALLEQQEQAVATEIPATQITPPPTTDEPIEKQDYQTQESSDTVRRQLFTQVGEQTSEEGMQQAEITGVQPETMPTGVVATLVIDGCIQEAEVISAQPESTTIAGSQQQITEDEEKPMTEAIKKAKHE